MGSDAARAKRLDLEFKEAQHQVSVAMHGGQTPWSPGPPLRRHHDYGRNASVPSASGEGQMEVGRIHEDRKLWVCSQYVLEVVASSEERWETRDQFQQSCGTQL